MNGLTEDERQESALLDDALRTYPLADTPPDFASRVMRRVRAESPAPRFRVTWRDYLISLLIPGTGLGLLLAWSSLPPQTAAYIQTRVVLLWQFAQRSRLDWAVFLVGLMLLGFLVGMTIRLLRPAYRRPRLVRTLP